MAYHLPTCVGWLAAGLAASFIPASSAAEPFAWRDVNIRVVELVRAGQHREAEAAALAGLKGCSNVGVEQPLCASILLQNAADAQAVLGKATEAEVNYRQSLAVRRQALPPRHPLTADSALRLGAFLQMQRRSAEAEPLFVEAAEAFRLAGPRAAEMLFTTLTKRHLALDTLGRTGDAITVAEEAQAVAIREWGEGSPLTLIAISNRIGALRQAGRPDEALDLGLATLARPAAASFPPRWRVMLAGHAAQDAHNSLRPDAARDATAVATAALILVDTGAADADAAVTLLLGLSRLVRDAGQHGVAAAYAARAESIARAAKGPRHEDVAVALSDRGFAELGRGDPRAALPLLDESASILGENGKVLARIDAVTAAIRALFALGQPDVAAARLDAAAVDPMLDKASIKLRAAAYWKIGNTWDDLGQPGKAASTMERAVAALAEAGSPLADQAGQLLFAAESYQRAGDLAGAADAIGRAMALLERKAGAEHLVVAAYRQLASVRHDQLDAEGALAAADKAVAALSDKTPALVRERPAAFYEAAGAYAKVARMDQARTYAQAAEDALTSAKPDAARADLLASLASFYESISVGPVDNRKAAALATQSRTAFEALGTRGVMYAEAIRVLGAVLVWGERPKDGEALCRQAEAMFAGLPGLHVLSRVRAAQCIGHAQQYAGRAAEAERTLAGALALLRGGTLRDSVSEGQISELLGVALRDQGHLEEAAQVLASARDTVDRTGRARGVSANLSVSLGSVLRRLGNLDGARAAHAAGLRTLDAIGGSGGLTRAGLLNGDGLALLAQGNATEAVPLLEEAARLHREMLPAASQPVAESEGNLALAYAALGRHEEATKRQDAAVAAYRALGPSARSRLTYALAHKADLARTTGDLKGAELALQEAVATARQTEDASSLGATSLQLALADLLDRQARRDEADALRTEAVRTLSATYGEGSAIVARARLAALPTLRAAGRVRDAAAAVESCDAALRFTAGDDRLLRLQCLSADAENKLAAGAYPAAREAAARALKAVEDDSGGPTLISPLLLVARAEASLGHAAEVAAACDRAVGLLASGPGTAPQRAGLLAAKGRLLAAAGDRTGAEGAFRSALALSRPNTAGQASTVAATNGLAGVLVASGRAREAVALWRDVLQGAMASGPAPLRAAALRGLAGAVLAVAASADAARAFDEAAALDRAGAGAASPDYVADVLGAAEALAQGGNWQEAQRRLDLFAGTTSPAITVARLDALASQAQATGDPGAALAHSRAANQLAEAEYGPGSVLTALLQVRLAHAQLRIGNRSEAAALLARAAEVLRPDVLAGQGAAALEEVRALLLAEEGRFDAAEAALARVEEAVQASQGPASLASAMARANRGVMLLRAGRLAQADQSLTDAMAIAAPEGAPRNPVWARIALAAAEVAERRGDRSRSMRLRADATRLLPAYSNGARPVPRWL